MSELLTSITHIGQHGSTGGSLLFQAVVLFSTENEKFWPVFAILSPIYALVCVLLQA